MCTLKSYFGADDKVVLTSAAARGSSVGIIWLGVIRLHPPYQYASLPCRHRILLLAIRNAGTGSLLGVKARLYRRALCDREEAGQFRKPTFRGWHHHAYYTSPRGI